MLRVAAAYDYSAMHVIADIGGGQGTLLAAIPRRHKHLGGILFDVPDVAPRAAGVLRDAGVTDRCEIVTGDFFAGVPDGADGYLRRGPRPLGTLVTCVRSRTTICAWLSLCLDERRAAWI